jgi:biotin carboxyl carrier protein
MAQQQVNVNGKAFMLEMEQAAKGTVNGKPFALDVQRVSDNIYHVIRDIAPSRSRCWTKARCASTEPSMPQKSVDRFDALLKQLGMDKGAAGKVAEVKAPMPGLVLKIIAQAGTVVSKGDALLVLEAMKMENVIKSPTDGTIASIEVQQGKTVEKNQVMVRFV